MRTIGEVAELAGISTATLRWYDRIGLLQPLARSDSGYRLYGREELLRLREILVWRQLGFPLSDIVALIDEPDHDRRQALECQLGLTNKQLAKFQNLSGGLQTALAEIDAGGSIVDSDVFAGFKGGLVDEPSSATSRGGESRRLRNFSLMSGRSQHGTASGGAPPRRAIVATDPIRMAESVLALGILPSAAWTYPDRTAEPLPEGEAQPGTWPWPPSVEPAIRSCIGDLGVYGSDGRATADSAADLVLIWEAAALRLPRKHPPTAVMSYLPYTAPGFRTWLAEIAAQLGIPDRGAALLDRWRARTAAFRPHLSGRMASILYVWGQRAEHPLYKVPRSDYETQIFSEVGLELTEVPNSTPDRWGCLDIEPGDLGDLDADTLFLGTYYLGPARLEELRESPAFARLPAATGGRVVQLGWAGVRSGWFTSHWELSLIARAYGLVQLRSEDALDTVYAVVDPTAGTVALAPAFRDLQVTLAGPGGARPVLELRKGQPTHLTLDPADAGRLCAFPEAYRLEVEPDGRVAALALDRESALERVAGGLQTAA